MRDKNQGDLATRPDTYAVEFEYGRWSCAALPKKNLIGVLDAKEFPPSGLSEKEIVLQSLNNPIGSDRLSGMVRAGQRVLILVDDYTRLTPAYIILPLILEELAAAGVSTEDVRLLIASGTHRAMDEDEKQKKCGTPIMEQFEILDHRWEDPSSIRRIGTTPQGTVIEINKHLLDADFIIGVGQIVPHRVAGFSGGAKIIQPGVCGAVTTGQTHWLSAKHFRGKEILGVFDNPVRREMNEVGRQAGLRFIVNTVQGRDGSVHACFSGDPVLAHKTGCAAALDVFGAACDELADVVIVDTFPAVANMWQASKGIYSADLALKDDGVLIVVALCPEGIASEHPEVETYGYADPYAIEDMVDRGTFDDLTVAAHILHVGQVISGKRKAILVSPHIPQDLAQRIGFIPAPDLEKAIEMAFSLKGSDASVTVIHHGGEVMPVHGASMKF